MPSQQPNPLRILIVDDEPLIRWSLGETLVEAGHLVTEAGDGATALETLAHADEPYHIVLLDYRLPDSNDLRLLSEMRRVSPRTTVIMMTAHGTPELADAARDLGAFGMVSKPFEVHDMAALVLQAHAALGSR